MCGRYTLTADPEAIQEHFQLELLPDDLIPRFNIAPTQAVPVITNDAPKQLTIVRWGLIPRWAKDQAIGSRMINARGETVDEKPAFRSAFQHRRCLVPADGFFEWQKQGKEKIPHYIRLKEHRLFAFAGLWERWQAPDGEEVLSCTIITTEPNEVVQPLHNRMAVVLDPADYELWLSQDTPADVLKSRLAPAPPAQMEAYQVSKTVNNPRNDTPDVIDPYQQPQQPGLL